MGTLIIDGNSVYEVDDECMQKRGTQGDEKEDAAKGSPASEK